MKFEGIRNMVIYSVVIAIFAGVVCMPGTAEARWEDNSGDLPGMDGGNMILIGVGAVALLGGVIWLVKRGGDDDTDTGSVIDRENCGPSDYLKAPGLVASRDIGVKGKENESLKSALNMKVEPLVGIGNGNVKLGVGFSF